MKRWLTKIPNYLSGCILSEHTSTMLINNIKKVRRLSDKPQELLQMAQHRGPDCCYLCSISCKATKKFKIKTQQNNTIHKDNTI